MLETDEKGRIKLSLKALLEKPEGYVEPSFEDRPRRDRFDRDNRGDRGPRRERSDRGDRGDRGGERPAEAAPAAEGGDFQS